MNMGNIGRIHIPFICGLEYGLAGRGELKNPKLIDFRWIVEEMFINGS